MKPAKPGDWLSVSSASEVSQSSSVGVGVVSQTSSSNGARWPSFTTAGTETR